MHFRVNSWWRQWKRCLHGVEFFTFTAANMDASSKTLERLERTNGAAAGEGRSARPPRSEEERSGH